MPLQLYMSFPRFHESIQIIVKISGSGRTAKLEFYSIASACHIFYFIRVHDFLKTEIWHCNRRAYC